MRRAKLRDRLEEARSSRRTTYLESLSYRNIEGLKDGELRLSPFLTTIVGGNGVGKSTLLSAIHCLIEPCSEEHSAFRSRRMRGAELDGSVVTSNGALRIVRRFDSDGNLLDALDETLMPLQCRFVELARDARRVVDWARRTGLEDRIQGHASRQLKPKQLDEVCALVRKNYTSVSISEIEVVLDASDPYSPSAVMPYFRVETDEGCGSAYGSENMGLGETMLLTAHWHLSDQRSNELLLIEECDSHIPDFSKDALFERIVEYSARTKASVVITTHSTRMVASVPPESLRVVSRNQSGAWIHPDPELLLSRRILDITSQVELVVLCEDRVAVALARAIVARYAPAAISACEFAEANGDSRLLAVLKNFPATTECIKVLGVLDGDQRGIALNDLLWPCVFLPGSSAPDDWLRRVVMQHQERVAQSLGVDPAALVASLNPFVGIDHHDWIERWPASVARTLDDVIRAVLQVCETVSDESIQVREVADSVANALRINDRMVHPPEPFGPGSPVPDAGPVDAAHVDTGSVLELLQQAGVDPGR